MKSFYVNNKYLLFCLFFLGLAAIVERSNLSFENNKPDVQTFENKLFDKEFKADEVLDSLYFNTQNKNLSIWVNNNSNNIDYLYREQGLVFLVYLNSDLIYWTNNSIAIPDNLYKYDQKFAKLGNSFVEIRKKENDSIVIVCLINIMDSYLYENKFLRNGFHTTFKLDCPHSLEVENVFGKNAIYNKEKEYLFSLKKEGACYPNIKVGVVVGFIIFAFIFLLFFERYKFKKVQFSGRQFVLFSVIIISVRIFIQLFKFPTFLSSLSIFQPSYFVISDWIPSLGDLLITVVMVTYLIFVFYTKVTLKNMAFFSKRKRYAIMALWMGIFILYALVGYQLFTHLIIDSSFQFEAYDVLNLSIFSLIGYFILLIIFIGLIILIDKACVQVKGSIKVGNLVLAIIGIGLLIIIVNIAVHQEHQILPWLFLFSVILYWVHIRLLYSPSFGRIVLLISIFALFSTYFIRNVNFEKRIEESKVIAVSLAREQDPVAEMILADVISDIKVDSIIAEQLESGLFNFNKMIDYINQTYFAGYLGRYNFQLTLCNDVDSVLLDENQQNWKYCYGFFNDLLATDGTETGISDLYYLRNISGGLNYFMRIPINLKEGWRDVTLFFELSARPNIEVLGYPELLLEKPVEFYDLHKSPLLTIN